MTGLARLLRHVRSSRPDVVHWQWAPLPSLDLRALRAASRQRRDDDLHGARRAAATLARRGAVVGGGLRQLRSRDRARSGQSRPAARRGRGHRSRAHRSHPARAAACGTRAPSLPVEQTEPRILFFGLIRPDKGLDVLIEALPAVAAARPGRPSRHRRQPAHADRAAARAGQRPRPRGQDQLGSALRGRRRRSGAARPRAGDRAPVPLDRGLGRVRDRDSRAACRRSSRPSATFPELCATYDLGEPVPPDDPAALAAALVRSLTDPALRKRAVAGMQRARSELTWERTAQLTMGLYERALADSARTPVRTGGAGAGRPVAP